MSETSPAAEPAPAEPAPAEPLPAEPEAEVSPEAALHAVVLRLARNALNEPPAKKGGSVILFVSLILFALSSLGDSDFTHVAVVLGVIFVHELGHLLGMWLFGYKDLRIFFIPFFGGGAMGKKRGAPAWQQVLVLFLGPLPGMIIGGVLALVNLKLGEPLLGDVATTMFIINVSNLAPVTPLDGGRIFELALFRRHWLLEAGFSVLCTLALIGLAFQGAYVLGIVGVLMLLSLPARLRFRNEVTGLRRQLGALPGEPAALSDEALEALLAGARRLQPAPGEPQNQTLRALWEELAQKQLGTLGAMLTLLLWLVCVGASIFGAVGYRVAREQIRITAVDDAAARWAADRPGAQATFNQWCTSLVYSPAPKEGDIACRTLGARLYESIDGMVPAQALLEPLAEAAGTPATNARLADALMQLAAMEEGGELSERHERAHRIRAAILYENAGMSVESAAAQKAAEGR